MKGINKIFLALFILAWIGVLVFRLSIDKGEALLELSMSHSDGLNSFFIITTQFAEEITYTLFALVFLFIRYRVSLAIAFTGIGVTIVAGILKKIFAFDRPFAYFQKMGMETMYNKIEGIEPYTGMTSFPSGHAMAGFALMSLLSLYLRNPVLTILFFLVGCIVGVSRIYLGHHFLEDVIFGSLLGVLVSYAVYFPTERWKAPVLDQSFLSSKRTKLNA
ncbi:phosphatase PAP2 family protein [Portibacter lacus]|uniref:Phosphatase PAP2 family protein n=1 Tax=Portibacter lacus TaxID=1099794 RepID=A0AA37SM41_9BACT|nr:phosphatase PAP2 family protein [Portibacter lacus]GLR16360.1 phosphatase PAP2 family protein [Portibacter lacus]